jgi:hypothetical protein
MKWKAMLTINWTKKMKNLIKNKIGILLAVDYSYIQ